MPNSLKANKKHPGICSSQNILVLGSKKMLWGRINLLTAVIILSEHFFCRGAYSAEPGNLY